jgi:phage major head subunit gpT-like protein
MAIIGKAALDGIQTNFKAIALDTFNTAKKDDLSGLVLDIPITGGKLDLSWVASLGKMREWLGDRQIRDLVAKNFTITPKHYEHTIGVDRDDIEDDNIGQYGPQIRLISAGAVKFMDDAVCGVLDNNSTCYDGQPLVDDSHPAFGPYAAFDNKNGTGALSADATGYGYVLAGLGMMAGFKDSDGRSLGLSAKALVVPGALEYVAKALVQSPFMVGTYANYNALAGLKVIVLRGCTDSTNWYLVDTDALVAPIIRGIRKQPEFVAIDNPSDSEVFKTKKFLYGVDARLDVVAGFPQAIVGAIVAG